MNVRIDLYKGLERMDDYLLRGQVIRFFEAVQPSFDEAPASQHYHHAYRGGLRAHTEEVMGLALSIAQVSPKPLNLDHVIAAAAMHDAGKVMPGGYDHALKPGLYWTSRGMKMPEEVRQAINTHMGGWSKVGYPDTLLSTVIHSADLISSRLEYG